MASAHYKQLDTNANNNESCKRVIWNYFNKKNGNGELFEKWEKI